MYACGGILPGLLAEWLALDETSNMVANRHVGERGIRYSVNGTGPE